MMTKRMTVMLIIVGIVFGGVAAFQLFRSYMIKKFLASMGNQPQTVSTMVAKSEDWMPALKAVGTLRAVRGTDIAPQVPGVVAAIPFKSSEEVKKGDLLLQLDDTDDAAKLRALKASAELARLTYNRTRQLAQKGTVSQAALDSATASLRSIEAQVAEQQALVAKKRISAPFAGSIGIRLVDVGQYVTPGQKITTLQTLDPIYMDFSLPQQNLQQIKMGQKVSVVTDTFPDLSFDGEITGLDPKVDPQTRNVSVRAQVAIRNVNRTVGTILGHEVTKRYAGAGLPDGTIDLTFVGSAGQSFGAFVPKGMTLRLEGDANDYVGKGLSGGRIVVRPDRAATFAADEQIIAGNVIAYGATSGEIFIRGGVGERCCVRNSGAWVVTEGVGDHGCEYMTGGRVAVLGRTGRNFAAGMSGGVAWVLDLKPGRVNPELVELGPVSGAAAAELEQMVRSHLEETGSTVAEELLADWETALTRFTEVMPTDYRKSLEAKAKAEADGLDENETAHAMMEALHG